MLVLRAHGKPETSVTNTRDYSARRALLSVILFNSSGRTESGKAMGDTRAVK